MKILRAVMIGDLVGDPGLKVLEEKLPGIIKDNAVDFAVVNGENSAGGFCMTDETLRRILAAGADIVTSGNHVWEKREFRQTLENSDKVLRPANYPPAAAGKGWVCVEKAGASWLVVNLQGRELMTPIDCPFRSFDSIVAGTGKTKLVLVDFHAESSREKEAMAYYVDGRAAVLAGTHTHVQTADERILPHGTAYITDLGMSGVCHSIIGMEPKICIDRVRKQVMYRMEPATEPATPPIPGKAGAEVQGVIAEIDSETGKAVSIKRLGN